MTMGAQDSDNTFYVATAIPYVNGAPHVGHAMEAIISDVLARYNRQLGKDTIFSIGTDEHGGKNMETAQKLGISPQRFVDQNTQAFKDLYKVLDVSYDRFIRTTDKAHEAACMQVWKRLEKFLYKSSYVGMYDQKEESFLTDEEARHVQQHDPERYARLHKLEEENYFFKLSEFTKPIKKAIESGEMEIVPKSRKNEILSLLNEGLEDISFSRPSDKISWGISVPGDAKQTMYVWVDALLNYITLLGYPDHADFKKFWPANVQVIGKDISRFHCAIWPAILLALGEEVPKKVYIHGFVTMNGQKMSKSIGNVVAPLEIVSAYGVDAMRYYFMRHIPSHGDGDFTWEKFEMAYNAELGNDLGNLVQRIASMVNRYQDGVIGEIPGAQHDIGPYHSAFDELRFDKALDYVWGLVRGLNQYIEAEKPWELSKQDGQEDHLQEIFAYSISTLLQIAMMLTPFMPQAAAGIRAVFQDEVVKNYDGVLFPKVHQYTPGK